MKIELIKVGELKTNCYLIEKNNKVIVVDPGDDFSLIKEKIDNKKVIGIFITHHHFDHIGALDELKKEYQIEGINIPVDGFDFEIIKTPGHSKDCLTFYFEKEKVMFTGDFLFFNTIGRIDLPGSSKEEMIDSLDKISKYPDDIKIYPGHGYLSTLGNEKKRFKYYF